MTSQTWHLILTSLPPIIKASVTYTIPLTLISFTLGLLLALLTAMVRLSPMRGPFQIVRGLFWVYVWIFRSTPLLVQLFIVFFGLPNIGVQFSPWIAAIITFTLNVGAYSSETIRAAILSIPNGQWEAAYTLGMTRPQVLFRIVLPQAARVSLPPLSNSFIGLVKDTSLASSITIVEMFMVGQQIAAKTYEPLLLYSLVAFVYLIICTVLTILQSYLEKWTSRYIQTGNN
ncbi:MULTISPECIES: amino acid ABC transporter permease [Loigolactobacillus]|uniref:Cysteine ABC transporter permease n=1 Tax=Loigolactobacillus backii TaxID=375175 RepID=A0A192GYF2_9LACO|nr:MULTISPECIES: amino acid ABC transporter permease [Loigolactobacillus]ANK58787.1 cysteine ABC transporter permease [Loigolactobacillus backii]ANK61549.1 cysteine ABC transporter permease [Loigolactobacillus backii]ANK63778.1 cysteine ABC transporter permease [Loigolactobacillus backii]ANK66226.1 cysteine ABC transporter permease [Loigolactobacillus backii]ANK69253.1 cysteine ABC transporter permease [Loigolactobacillus backii]